MNLTSRDYGKESQNQQVTKIYLVGFNKATNFYQKTSTMASHLTLHLMLNEFCFPFLNNKHLQVVFAIKVTNQALPPKTGLNLINETVVLDNLIKASYLPTTVIGYLSYYLVLLRKKIPKQWQKVSYTTFKIQMKTL